MFRAHGCLRDVGVLFTDIALLPTVGFLGSDAAIGGLFIPGYDMGVSGPFLARKTVRMEGTKPASITNLERFVIDAGRGVWTFGQGSRPCVTGVAIPSFPGTGRSGVRPTKNEFDASEERN